MLMKSFAARIRCKAVAGSFGAGVVPGSLPNTKAGTRCIEQLSDVSTTRGAFAAPRVDRFLGRTVNVVLKRTTSGEAALFKQQD